MTDPIADMLTRIRNALRVRQTKLQLPYSRTKFEIATILQSEGWIRSVSKVEGTPQLMQIDLKYGNGGESVIRNVKRISKPGHRVYANKKELPVVLGGIGLAIVSTSSGMMTSKQAYLKGLGGEVICEIF